VDFWNNIAVILSLAALFAYINERWLRLSVTIGIMFLALLFSLLLVVLQQLGWDLAIPARQLLERVNFDKTVLHGMVGFLLFAGALSLDVGRLRQNFWVVGVLATVGTILSTLIVGTAVYVLLPLLGMSLGWWDCLLFGALISPTDPVAVLSILRKAHAPVDLEMQIAGESLFNDGVGLTLFLLLSQISLHQVSGSQNPEQQHALLLFLQEAGGGILFGAVLGISVYALMRGIRDHRVVILMFLAVASGGFALAEQLQVSGALSMVVAGLILGHDGRHYRNLSGNARNRVELFWELVDELLNTLLFMLLGLEFLLVFKLENVWPILAAIPIVIAARFSSVSLPWVILRHYCRFDRGALAVMTWGGLRGGVAVALALSLPAGEARDAIVAMTYGVVIFSILVQGTTVRWVVKHYE
jgi:CPA1 family monovalent cation:H+ antiporter